MTVAAVARSGARLLGELLVTAGVVVLLFAAYLMWGTNLKTAAAQDNLRDELRREWAQVDQALPAAPTSPAPAVGSPFPTPTTPEATAPAIGAGVALLRFPTLGDADGTVVVQGVTVAALRRGPGHYPGSAQPGEVGNVVLSGHRTTYGAPFADVGELVEGDAVVLETATAVHTYRVTTSRIVAPTAIEVTYPVPGQPGVAPTRRLLTLTTCHPKYSARQRLIVHAELAETVVRASAPGAGA